MGKIIKLISSLFLGALFGVGYIQNPKIDEEKEKNDKEKKDKEKETVIAMK